jgi:hypothetical protein
VTIHGIWTQHGDDENRLIALISHPDGTNPVALERDFMASPEFAADMDGFDSEDIVTLGPILLEPTPSSPLR